MLLIFTLRPPTHFQHCIMTTPHILTNDGKTQSNMMEIEPKHEAEIANVEELKVERDIPQLKSEFDRMTIGAAFTKFKWSTIICVVAGFSAATDGKYLYLISGIKADD